MTHILRNMITSYEYLVMIFIILLFNITCIYLLYGQQHIVKSQICKMYISDWLETRLYVSYLFIHLFIRKLIKEVWTTSLLKDSQCKKSLQGYTCM